MNDQQIDTLIRRAEKSARSSAFVGTRIGVTCSILLIPMLLFNVVLAAWVTGLLWAFTYLMWATEQDSAHALADRPAQLIWEQIGKAEFLGADDSVPMQGIIKQIATVYEHDPKGELFPLSQAVRLSLAWKQLQERRVIVEHRVEQMTNLRAAMLEKQQLLHDLGDENAVVETSLARLDGDIGPLKRSGETLRASRDRLEALVVAVEAVARRRQLHREIGELAAQLPEGKPQIESPFSIEKEPFDIERQISREIETFLELERETDTHLRDL